MSPTRSTAPFLGWKPAMNRLYGHALYRVPLDLGFGCPNRAADGTGGCIFCPADGARAVQLAGAATIREQVAQAMRFARQRYRARHFMAYVQAFTGTFTPASEQRTLLTSLLDSFPFEALAVGTRPDCLPDDTLSFLRELNKRVDVWVELGVQTTHDTTLRRINRGHDWACSRDAILRLHDCGLRTAAHLIVGLPGETTDQILQTAETLAALPLAAIKIHNLHVVRGTALAAQFADTPFPVLDEHAYADILIEILRRLPEDLPIMRLSTDTPAGQLVAPAWTMAKGQFLDYVIRQMRAGGVRQGDLAPARPGRAKPHPRPAADSAAPPEPVATDDGSVTFWNARVKEHYHARIGARAEAQGKFVGPSGLAARLQTGDVRLLDICFGLGYNGLTAANLACRLAAGRLHVTGLEMDRGVVAAAAAHLLPEPDDAFSWRECLRELADCAHCQHDRFEIDMHWGDARAALKTLPPDARFDIVFLDAFSTQRNSELWTVDFFRRLHALMPDDAVLLTYSAALPVRAGLRQAGFHVGATSPPAPMRPGTIAARSPAPIALPLPDDQLELMDSSRAIPYRDPDGTWSNKQILRHREQAVRTWKSAH